MSKFLNLLCTCPQYQCSKDLLDDRRGSLKFITPLDVSFGKSTKYWLSMTKEILTSSNLRNWNNTCVRNLQFYPSLRRTLLLAILKVTDARRDVIMARGLHRRFHLSPESIGGRPSGPSPLRLPFRCLVFACSPRRNENSLDLYCFPFVTNKKHENIVAKKGHSYSLNYAQLVQ